MNRRIIKSMLATLSILSIGASFFLSSKPAFMLGAFAMSIVFVAVPHYFSDQPKEKKPNQTPVSFKQQVLARQKREIIEAKMRELQELQNKDAKTKM